MNSTVESVSTTSAEHHQVSNQSMPVIYDYRHGVAVYVIVIGFLFVINALTDRDYWWVVWPALGWGLAIALKILKTRFPK